MAGKNNTERIEALESQAATLSARLDMHDRTLEILSDGQVKGGETASGHGEKIVLIEKQLIVLENLKGTLAAVTGIEKDLIVLRKDLEAVVKWQEEEKRRRETWGQRFWMIVPPLLAALFSSTLTAILTYMIGRRQ